LIYDGTSTDTDADAAWTESMGDQTTSPDPVTTFPNRNATPVDYTVKGDDLPGLKMSEHTVATWLGATPDTEGVAIGLNQSTKLGTWIVHKKSWGYSMAWLDSTAALTTPTWRSEIQDGDIYTDLPNHLNEDPDQFECMWPLSACIKIK
jgi:hypothetical protein